MTRIVRFRSASSMGRSSLVIGAWLLLGLSVLGCRGHVSKKPPVRLIRDMTQQVHLLPQAAPSAGMTSRNSSKWLAGTVAVEEPIEIGLSESGRDAKGFVARAPLSVDTRVLARGKARFNLYCSGCHDQAGMGQGVVVQRGFPGPIELSSDNTRRMADGEIFSIITKGVRNMPAMGDQIPAEDRWPIVVWVRVLQRSQHARIAEVGPIRDSDILPEEVEQ